MDFFGMGPGEIIVIRAIGLIIFGPGRLPELAQQVGKVVREFRSATRDLTSEFRESLSDVEHAAEDVKKSATEVRQTARESLAIDQATFRAAQPARPLPEPLSPAAARVPTKDDPLADLFPMGDDVFRSTDGRGDGTSNTD